MLLGVHLTLYIGQSTPSLAPIALTEALSAIEVTQNESDHSGFQLTFQVGRNGPFDLRDYNLLKNPLLRPFIRVVVEVRFNLEPFPLLDGIITHTQLTPSEEPGATNLTVTGENISRMMDLEQHIQDYPNQNESQRLNTILDNYNQFINFRDLHDLPSPDGRTANEHVPMQSGTDYQYLQDMANSFGYVFYVRPAKLAKQNLAYFGPRGQPDMVAEMFPPPPLSVNMGPQTNVDSINFSYNSLAFTQVSATATDPQTNEPVDISSHALSTDENLADMSPVDYQNGTYRKLLIRPPQAGQSSQSTNPQARHIQEGLTPERATAVAQGITNESALEAVTASGELDGLRYGAVLQAHTTVEVRGVGATFDGKYFVQSVNHSISKGQYKQRFTLKRGGVFPTRPLVQL